MPRRGAAERFPRTVADASIHLIDPQLVRFIPGNSPRAGAVSTCRWHWSVASGLLCSPRERWWPLLGMSDDCWCGVRTFCTVREVRVSRTDEKDLDRRNFLKCMAWVGTGAVWTLSSGVLKGCPLEQAVR